MKSVPRETRLFESLADAVRASFVRHNLPANRLPQVIFELEAVAAGGDYAKGLMLDLFLFGEIEISRLEPGRGTVFTATRVERSTPPKEPPPRAFRRRAPRRRSG